VFRDFERQCVIDLGEFGGALGHLSLKPLLHPLFINQAGLI
jgi:hypothetical protein